MMAGLGKIIKTCFKGNVMSFFTWILLSLFMQNGWSQNLATATANTGSITTTSSSFVDVTGASVTISATARTKVLVTASFSGKTISGSAVGTYRLVDDQSHVSGELQRTQSGKYGIGSVVYIFDVTTTGSRTYKFQHKTSAQTLESNVTLTAVALYDGTTALKNNVKTLSTPIELLSDTFESAIESDIVSTTAAGGFYVSASVQTANTAGTGTVVGEWALQYKYGIGGAWTTFNYAVSRSTSDTGIEILNLVAALPNNRSAGDYSFRVAHRKVSGADPYITQAGNLVVVGLGTNSGYFPVMSSTKVTSTNATSSPVDVFNTKITAQSATSLFLHAQYNTSAATALDAKYDLFAKQNATTVLDGLDLTRNLSSSSDSGSGTNIELVPAMTAGLPYDISLRHTSVGTTTLTTSNAYLVGFGTNRSSMPFTTAVNVYATEGVAFSSFNTLKEAFDAINGGAFKGTVNVEINSSISETATAELFASGTGNANYNTVSIYPTTTGITISGSSLAVPLINLNGADNVTFDGRVNKTGTTKSLTISNTLTTGSVIQYINDASDNTIRYCTIQGVTTATNSGLIVYSTGTATGNDNNTIEYCDIRDGATTPTNAIYSSGSSIVADNSAITISNNNIYNYFSPSTSSNGIYIAANSAAWTIDNNRFYQTATRVTTSGTSVHRGIYIVTSSGVSYNILNNTIGFADASGTITGFTNYNSGVSTTFRGIEMTVGALSASSVQGNTISNITFSTNSSTTSTSGIFSGISILAGQVNIGTVAGNTIGNATGATSISISSTTSGGLITGIYSTSVSDVAIQNNKIGSFTITGATAIGYTFRGINTVGIGGNYTISSNVIGSATTTNSITVGSDGITTTGVCRFDGINNSASGVISISNNTVQNTSVYGTGLSIYYGIVNTGGSGTLDILGNSIISGTNTGTHTSTTQTYYPIYNSAAVSTLNINNNIIKNQLRTQVSGFFTAIANAGIVLDFININGNKLGDGSDSLINYSSASTAALVGINNSAGAASCELSIQNNDIRGITYSTGITGANAHTYIINSAATLKQFINTNTFTNLNVNTTGAILFISNSVAMPTDGEQYVNYNKINGSFTRIAGSGAITLFTSTTATNNTGVTVTNNNNDFSNVNINGTATISGWINTDAGEGLVTKTIEGNKFENWTGGTGAITALNVNITSTDNAVKNNSISNINSAGIIYGIITAAGNDNIFSNSINNLKSEGGVAATIVSGINVTSGTIKNIYSNTIYNLTGNTLTSGTVRGISISGGINVNAYKNTIYGITANAIISGTLSGVLITGGVGSLVNVDSNKIYNISSTSSAMSGAVYGIQVSGTTATANLVSNISNNTISDLRASVASLANPVIGIGVISTGTTSNINVYYNTIYLNASSTGTNFGSSGIYHAASSVATTAVLELRNNIIVNNSTPKGTGYTVAFRRSSGASGVLNNYSTASNNNLFYAGTPGTYRLIYYDGTAGGSFQTLALYKSGSTTAGTISPRDQAAVTENPNFLSTTGTDADFLHINTSIATQIESGAVNIPGFTNDFDGQVRQGNDGYVAGSTTAPDIGADEGNFSSTDTSAPSISYTLLTSTSCTTTQTISATITDATGVNTTSGTRPRIYYKKSTNSNVLLGSNTNTTDGWKYVEASNTVSPFVFNIDYSLINGGVTTGSIIQYFVVAQDNIIPITKTTSYVGINNGTFSVTPSSVNLPATAFPIGGTINSYTLLAGLSGTVTVGSGGTYPTLTGVGGLFENINSKGISADLRANIISDITSEDGSVSLNAISYGCASYNTLTIAPIGNRIVSGLKDGGALINFNGADNVVIDGLNTGGNTLTITNTSTSNTAGTSTIRFIADATNDIVRNCTIQGSSNLATSGTILFSTGISTGNYGNTISNNTIKPASGGIPINAIYSAGSSVFVANSNNVISNNNFEDYLNPSSTSNGIYIASNSTAWTINNNKFYQTTTLTLTANVTNRAIQIVTASGASYTISNNIIGFANALSTGVSNFDSAFANIFRGIELTVSSSTASNIQGNTIAGISFTTASTTATLPGVFTGISVLAGTVNIGTTTANTIGSSVGSGQIIINSIVSGGAITGIYAKSAASVIIQNNNIGGISTAGAAAIANTFYGIYTIGGGQFTVSSNNIGNATANSIAIGVNGVTTALCTLNGITNATTGTISITENTIRNASVYGSAASVMNGILNSGISSSVTINNNNIIGLTNAGSGTLIGISNTAAATILSINNNIIRNIIKSVAAGTVTGISNSGVVLSSITIDNNQLGNSDGGLINYTVANSAALIGISNSKGSANCDLSIQNNNFQGITYAVAGTNANTYIINLAPTLSQNISGNTFTNLSVNTTGTIIFISNIVIMPTNGVQNVNNNSIVTGFTRTAASGALTLFTSTASTNNSNVVVNNNNNNFSNITINGSASIAGWINTDAGLGNPTKTIDGNTFNNWNAGSGTGTIIALTVNINSTNNATKNNTISNITSAGAITGILTGVGNDNIFSNIIQSLVATGTTAVATAVKGIAIAVGGTVKNIYSNTIYDLRNNTTFAGLSVSGIEVAGGALNNLYNNKIHSILSTISGIANGGVNGILVTAAVDDQITNIHNNRIGNIFATSANVTDAVRGISIVNAGLRSVSNVYFNTVYLNTTSSNTNFGSSAIYHATNSNSTTGALNLRNNIIVNTSTAKGTGFTVAFRRSSGLANDLKNYSSLSNNNLFYAGTPSAMNLIYSDGTSSAQTLASYSEGIYTAGTISPRDQVSVSQAPDFLSTDGTQANFLKMNSNSISFVESGGAAISGITTDFDGDIRAGNPGFPAQTNGSGTAPDIGADEFDGKAPNVVVADANANSNGVYINLATAFAAINSYDQTAKNINVSFVGSFTESSSAVLNAGLWTSLKMFPTKVGITVSGNIANVPLIDLNGADNVTIDGRLNQSGSIKNLSISNTSTSASATATIRLINSAENNTLKYFSIYGSSTSTTNGVVTFGSSASGNGNDNNIIEYCNLSNAAANRPVNAVYSAGSSGSENNSITLRNNNFYDFLNKSTASNGIYLNAFTSDCTITNNSFYETTNFIPTGSAIGYNAIRIDNTSGNNFTITNNFIGGTAASSGGTAWTVNSLTSHSFVGMYLNVGSTAASSIQNNSIKNWNYTTASATPWRAIEVNNGAVNIGTVTANIIGANTGTGSVTISSSVNAKSYAIYIGSTGTNTISKNSIGSITLLGSNSASHSFSGIYKASVAGTTTITSNLIGSNATSNSIYCASTASSASIGQDLIGIQIESSGTATLTSNIVYNLKNEYAGSQISRTRGVYGTNGTITLSKNNIYNLSSASTETSAGSVIGVEMNGTTANATVTENNIYNLSNTNAAFTGFVAAIRINGLGLANLVNRNFIRDLSVHTSTVNASIYGLQIINGTSTYANNIITLGGNTKTTIYGIYSTGATGNNANIYFNTIYVGGSLGTGTSNKSYAFYEAAGNNTRDLRNNIFSNFRLTVGGSSLHYGIFLNYSSSTNLTLDYNNYYAPGVGGVPGYYNSSNKLTTPIVSAKDSNSTVVDPQFIIAGGNAATDYKLSAALDGINGTGIILDYSQTARGNPPNIGSWEFNDNRWLGTVSTDFATAGNWSAGSVPLDEAAVVFALTPLNHCILDGDRTLGSIVNNQSTYNFITNGHELTLVGGLYMTAGAKIDASSAGTKLIFQGHDAQTISDAAFLGDTVPSVTIDNVSGVTTEGSFTITDALNLNSANPSSTLGCFDTGANIITLGPNAVVLGNGDVTGIINRTGLTYNQYYTFGNKNATVYFENNGNPLPSSISVKMSIGAAPSWRPNSINRIYEFIQTGANPLLPTAATISGAYLDSELNGNDENALVFQSYRTPSGMFFEHGRASNDPDDNWIRLTNIDVSFFPSAFGILQLSLGLSELDTLTWNGSVSTSWTSVLNWTPNGAPSDFVNVIIPNTTSITNKPILSSISKVKTLNMKNGATLNSLTNAQLTVVGGDGAWADEGGTFNSGTSTVIFTNLAAKFSGTTTFNNITIDDDAYLYMADASYMKIKGAMINNGLWSTSSGVLTTVEYNGGNQTVVIPNPATNRYSSLILSGTGVKTMPVSVLTVLKNLQISGTASATALNNVVIGGDLSIGTGTTFNCGSEDHNIGGNISNNGTFTTNGSNITLDGFATQTLSGTNPIVFENLTVNNVANVNLSTNTSVNGALTLTDGQINLNSTTFGIGGALNLTNGKLNPSTLSSLNVYGTGNLTFPTNLFTTNPSIKDFTLNRNGILNLSSQNLSVSNALNLTLGNLKLNNTTFTLTGNTLASTGGNIDASAASDTFVFGNSSPIILPSGTFNASINNLTINGSGGITSQGDIAVNKILNLQAANPSAIKGILDLTDGVNLKTLTMGVLGTTIGTGDATGILRRTSFSANENYTFGNQYTFVSFDAGGTYPTELKVKIQIGTAPAWQTLTTPIKRIYDFVQTGGVGCTASITTHYLDSELNGNTKNNLAHWTFGANGQTPNGANEWGSSDSNTTNNWVTINNLLISYFPTAFGNLENTLASKSLFDLIWKGSVSSVWGNLNNWSPLSIPSANSKIIIPDATTTLNDPTLASSSTILNMTLQSGAILNGSANATLNIVGDAGAWKNQGGVFNANTSTVTFNNANAAIEGATDFYNLVIPTNYSLNMLPLTHVGIAGTLTNNGTLNSLPLNGSTLEYNGADQLIALPNPSNNHYYNLILSGSGIKTLPNATMGVFGNLSMSGSAATTTNNAIQIDGNLNLSGTAQNTFNANGTVLGGMNLTNTSSAVVNPNKTLSVTGSIVNSVGTTGIVLKSDATGTASLIHNTDNVPATVERYISGGIEDWHFLSSPVSNQSIGGTWLPAGTYGNGTGYDLYVWDEPTPCWVYKTNLTGTPNWPTVHTSANFVPGRGYLYSVQATNPTKEFVGNLNNGTINYPITANSTTDAALKGFNLIGNPYPSSIDWTATSGWTRSNLLASGTGYDMWIWNPAANNYGVYNSNGSTGTNGVTQNIAPMQGFFVRAATNANITMTNTLRTHTGASSWMRLSNKNSSVSDIKVRITSDSGLGYDEVLLQFGYTANKSGAAKLFSTVDTAPSAYFKVEKEELSVRYLTNTIENAIVPLTFKSGKDGDYTFSINGNAANYDYVQLEDKKTKTIQNLLENPTYKFKGLVKDDANRFALHFGPETTVEKELSSLIYYNGTDIVVDLSTVQEQTEVKIYDVLGKLILKASAEAKSIQHYPIRKANQMLIVVTKSGSMIKKVKVLTY